MKRIKLFFLTSFFLMLSSILITAQDQDIMWLELDDLNENRDIAEVIEGDTTAAGERVNPDRIYGLRNGGFYFLSGRIRNIGYHLRIRGEARSNDVLPPIVMLAVDENLESDNPMIEASGDVSLSNIYFIGSDENASESGSSKRIVETFISGVTVRIDSCIFEYCNRGVYSNQKPDVSVFLTNSLIRNHTTIKEKTTTFRWFIQIKKTAADTIWIENNTFMNIESGPYQVATTPFGSPKYFYFNHNTMVNGAMMPFHFAYWQNAEITNNIFYSMQSCGDTFDQRGKQLPDANHPFSIVAIDTIDIDSVGLEQSRNVVLSNNAWFVPDDVLKMQADSSDITSPIEFITDREKAMFADKNTWPGLSLDSTTLYYEDPGFVNEPDKRTEFVAYCAAFLEKPFSPRDIRFDWDWHGDDVEPWEITWPITEDLSYSNATLLSGGKGGFPVGDLNWFPQEKENWEDQLTSVSTEYNSLPEEYSLSQNYPNPFNPTTEIKFSLPRAGHVTLEVYNLLGQSVAQLVNEELNTGSYKFEFDASNLSSGVYIYQIHIDNFVQSKKMLLIK